MSGIIVVKKEDLEEVINTLEEALAMIDDPLAPRDSLVSAINYAYSRLHEIMGKEVKLPEGEKIRGIEELKKRLPEIREKDESLADHLEWVIGVLEALGYAKPEEHGVKQG